ncbi:hypothetical protein [Pyrobaculum aerophilum]|nr:MULTISPECIES: hypothetical protein [Pyrobaculum]MCX8136647.1 hypothetical protein [Pyrobaculum aerophilum]RFA93311.1 hypothetical protein CGL51_13190 [Pyrobaculum aerophilum]RFA95086.1 hypothetical protein CGL52_13310 [Pyrobaculum aerophilum]
MKRAIVYVLSAVSLILGALTLISALSSPSTDPVIFARDLAVSSAAVVVGATAPLLLKKFSQQER